MAVDGLAQDGGAGREDLARLGDAEPGKGVAQRGQKPRGEKARIEEALADHRIARGGHVAQHGKICGAFGHHLVGFLGETVGPEQLLAQGSHIQPRLAHRYVSRSGAQERKRGEAAAARPQHKGPQVAAGDLHARRQGIAGRGHRPAARTVLEVSELPQRGARVGHDLQVHVRVLEVVLVLRLERRE